MYHREEDRSLSPLGAVPFRSVSAGGAPDDTPGNS